MDKIVHTSRTRAIVAESLGDKYGFRINYRVGEEESVVSDGSRLSDYYDGSISIETPAGMGSTKYYHEDEKEAVKIQRYIIYPKMSLTIMMECTAR